MQKRGTLFIAACLVLGFLAALPQPPRDSIGLAQGIMAGEVTATGAILQARLTAAARPTDHAWSRILGAPGVARFEYSTSPGFRNSRHTAWLEARPENDFIVKTSIAGLQPDTRYHYRLHFGEDPSAAATSTAATFRTNAGPGRSATYRFGIVTGMNYSFFHHTGGPLFPAYSGPDKHLGFPGLASILKLSPDYFIGTGDNVYYDHPAQGRAETIQQLRMKHHEQYSQPRFIELFRSVGTYWEKDDHDYRFNDADPVNPFRPSAARRLPEDQRFRISGYGSQPSHELGIYIFKEQLPVVPDPADPNALTYRTLRVSKGLQLWFVEGRDYRSPNNMPDGPQKTIWGEVQKEWLKRTLAESDATFKILVSPTPMIGPDSAGKRDSHANLQGFRHERDEFFRWLVQNGFLKKHFYIICGDRHWQYHAIDPSGIEEFSVGALVEANAFAGIRPGDPKSTDPEGAIRHLHFNETPTAGFLLFTAGPGEARFDFYDEFGKQLYSAVKRAP